MCWCWPAEVGCGDSTELFKSSPATAVPSKRCFSVAGDVSRSRHASLSASILGDLVFIVKRRLVCPFVICVFSLLWVWNTVLTAPYWLSAHRTTVLLAGSKRTVAPVYLFRPTSIFLFRFIRFKTWKLATFENHSPRSRPCHGRALLRRIPEEETKAPTHAHNSGDAIVTRDRRSHRPHLVVGLATARSRGMVGSFMLSANRLWFASVLRKEARTSERRVRSSPRAISCKEQKQTAQRWTRLERTSKPLQKNRNALLGGK